MKAAGFCGFLLSPNCSSVGSMYKLSHQHGPQRFQCLMVSLWEKAEAGKYNKWAALMCLWAASCRLWSLTCWWQLRDSLRGLWDTPQCELLQINLASHRAHQRNVLGSIMALRWWNVITLNAGKSWRPKGSSQRHVVIRYMFCVFVPMMLCRELVGSLGAAPGVCMLPEIELKCGGINEFDCERLLSSAEGWKSKRRASDSSPHQRFGPCTSSIILFALWNHLTGCNYFLLCGESRAIENYLCMWYHSHFWILFTLIFLSYCSAELQTNGGSVNIYEAHPTVCLAWCSWSYIKTTDVAPDHLKNHVLMASLSVSPLSSL